MHVKEEESQVSVGVAFLEGELPQNTTIELSLMAKSVTADGMWDNEVCACSMQLHLISKATPLSSMIRYENFVPYLPTHTEK